MAKQSSHPNLFVVYVSPKDKADVSHRLAPIGSIEELDDTSMLLRLPNKVSQPVAQWRKLVELVGSLATVLPVLQDEQGHTQFPTGDVTVRFLKRPSNKQLKEFAEQYQLRLRDRNEFVAEQAAFQLQEPAVTYLPDVIQQLAAGKDVSAAWANTRSRYKRMTES